MINFTNYKELQDFCNKHKFTIKIEEFNDSRCVYETAYITLETAFGNDNYRITIIIQ